MKALNNRVQLIGFLGADPEMKTFNDGKVMAKMSLATNEATVEKGRKAIRTQWHQLVAWGKLAEICGKYLQKGGEIAVEGRIAYSSFTDREGVNRLNTQITINDLLMITARQTN
ncbi:MAG TPA: single-stranded DNA-binding protein [Lentimicrobium sp.]|nr:single-stranded DNA-binding protein [Lentimicrobium sp.]